MLVHAITTNAAYEFASDVRAGLTRAGQKELLSKYLYDDVGSALFEVISRLPEYGLTRADERLLRRHASEIVDSLAMPVAVAELGSGSGKKARWVLEALCRKQRTFYYPVEISRSALVMCERELSDIDSISILGFEREYLDGLLEVAAQRRDRQHLFVLFLGILVGQKPAVVVGFETMVEMHVIEVRRHRFLSQFVRLRAEKRNVESSQQRNQRLENAIGVGSNLRVC